MDDATHKAIADLSALSKDADSEDAERIREIIERLKNFDAQLLMLTKRTAHLHTKICGLAITLSATSVLCLLFLAGVD
jgi:hypothetical protein